MTLWVDESGDNCREYGTVCMNCVRRPFGLLTACDDFKPLYPIDDGAHDTAPVGTRTPGHTASGVADLLGNVWEWTSTPYQGPTVPGVPPTTRYAVRGGGFLTASVDAMRAANREGAAIDARYPDVGFRCVARPNQAAAAPASSAKR